MCCSELIATRSRGETAVSEQSNVAERQAPPWPAQAAFIKAWQCSRTLRETCSKLGMKRGAAKVKAARFRQRGIPLKVHEADPAVESYPDWEALAVYAAALVYAGDESAGGPTDGP